MGGKQSKMMKKKIQ